VLEAIGDAKVPIDAALCFIGSGWNLLAKPFKQGGVWVTWPKNLSEMVAAPGSLTPADVTQLADRLASLLPSAVPPR
jgi:hypothetical protein